MWPVFVYSYLNLVSKNHGRQNPKFFYAFKDLFAGGYHQDELRKLEPITLPEHVENSDIGKLYMNSKYRVNLGRVPYNTLLHFLEHKVKDGGYLIINILQTNLNIVTRERTFDDHIGFIQLLNRAREAEDYPAEDEGIPGHNPGSANVERNDASTVLTKLKLGPMPMEPDLLGDVRAELAEEDVKNPPAEGQSSLAQHFEQQLIKREDSEERPIRSEIPMPPSTARDVAMEVQKLKEHRDRFKIPAGKTGGVSAGVSVTMFTFHNTFDR